jgi:uncharacterized protein (TIGR03067 family)
MNQRWIVSVSLCLLSTGRTFAQAPPEDLAALQGSWEVAKLVIDGVVLPEKELKQFRFSIQGNRLDYSIIVDGRRVPISFSVTVDKRQAPHSIDAKLLTGAFVGGTCTGRFDLDENRLTICLPDRPGAVRPATIESKPGTGVHLITLTRR